MNRVYGLLIVSLLAACASDETPAPSQETGEVRTVATGLRTPWEMIWGPDGRIWLTEREGIVSRIDPGTGEKKVLLKISDVHEESEAGLLGMALHPDFVGSPQVFLVYTWLKEGKIVERLVRYRYDAGSDELVEPAVLLDGLKGWPTHDGSRLQFLTDGTLLMTTGDAQDQPGAQDRSRLNGKVLRLNTDGSIPADNPDPRTLVWSSGHRNAQGLDLASNGILYSSEHGASSDDELNIIERGRNYGWPDVEGPCDGSAESTFCRDSNVVEPIRAWTPTIAVAGVEYYDSPAIPAWRNSLLLATLKGGLRRLQLAPDGRSVVGETTHYSSLGRLRDICVSPEGRIFICTSNRDGRGSARDGDDRIVEVKP